MMMLPLMLLFCGVAFVFYLMMVGSSMLSGVPMFVPLLAMMCLVMICVRVARNSAAADGGDDEAAGAATAHAEPAAGVEYSPVVTGEVVVAGEVVAVEHAGGDAIVDAHVQVPSAPVSDLESGVSAANPF